MAPQAGLEPFLNNYVFQYLNIKMKSK